MEILPYPPPSEDHCSNVKGYVEAGNYLLSTKVWSSHVESSPPSLPSLPHHQRLLPTSSLPASQQRPSPKEGRLLPLSSLCTRCEVLQQSIWDLERKYTAMQQEITAMQQEMKRMQQEITTLKNELEPFKATSLKYHKVLRRIFLSEAKRKVTDILKKVPAPKETWESFMLGLTLEEVGTLNLSPDAVNVLGTGAYYLNKAAHEAPSFEVAVAIIDAPTRKEMWEELFQFCYGVPTWDVIESYKQSDL